MSNKKWVVFTASIFISLALGVLYTWSILKSAIEASVNKGGLDAFQWDMASINDPYSVAILTFAFVMIISGKVFDRFGPRITSLIGGILIVTGLLLAASSTNYINWIIGFGILVGGGIGFGYAVITPATVKWFPPEKTGLITGFVVGGFGLSSVFIAPLFSYLIKSYDISFALYVYASIFSVIVGICSFLLFNPPHSGIHTSATSHATSKDNIKLSDILKKSEFYILWILFFIGSGAGLMVIGFTTDMVKKGLGEEAFLGVAIIAIGNSGGRVAAGYLSDRIGRLKTLSIMFLFQCILMVTSALVSEQSISIVLLLLVATFIGFNYGSNLSLFPSITKDLWGMKNFGINYGALFTAWGVGGFVLSRVSQMIKATTGSLEYSFWLAGVLLAVGSILLFLFERLMKQKGH
ncbi:MAG: OFA family MFS transporter [Candidatus Kapaibacterium sp.]